MPVERTVKQCVPHLKPNHEIYEKHHKPKKEEAHTSQQAWILLPLQQDHMADIQVRTDYNG
ncbi:hypothetical protein K435DRAFT_880394 [Dendrothele bispora CBS 962.96]|uniref:Uncharacterized protein n=1 Tax=Dendrothele bispora (strain CBS 962.96) TaxID=1314807 RepID=A0A4S8KJN6_DENBC|nr:hypothetical protein K435DRAFT_880394 [Dendrothele bispora CBS 962.96]